MNCTERITYVIRRGDTLYSIAKHFDTTIEALQALNPNLNPYNLRIGSTIIICENDHIDKKLGVSNAMRTAWTQQAYWSRLGLISLLEGLGDEQETMLRLMQIPQTIAQIFADYYSPEAVTAIEKLIYNYLSTQKQLLTAIKDKNMELAGDSNALMHKNADMFAQTLSSLNKSYKYEQIRQMLYSALDLTLRQAALRLSKNYADEIEVFNDLEQETLHFADYLTQGLFAQFPERF